VLGHPFPGGDLVGRIYEYLLQEFSIKQAIDKGVFFTRPALVQTIVNVIEPDHGIVLDATDGSVKTFFAPEWAKKVADISSCPARFGATLTLPAAR
jgi:hypothetical protein